MMPHTMTLLGVQQNDHKKGARSFVFLFLNNDSNMPHTLAEKIKYKYLKGCLPIFYMESNSQLKCIHNMKLIVLHFRGGH